MLSTSSAVPQADVPQFDVVLTTQNAKWEHASFGLRCLFANMAKLQPRTTIVERTIHDRASDIVEALLQHEPKIVGLSVYIWNVTLAFDVVTTLKRVRPDIVVVLGGPEVSHAPRDLPLCEAADFVITGEADIAFAALCARLLQKPLSPSLTLAPEKWIAAPRPDLASLASPYVHYTDDDMHKRILYVEASRGCPFTCEFCLSALDEKVRAFPLDAFLADIDQLLLRFRGGRLMLKFVDRTFNLKIDDSARILQFFLDRLDRLPPGLHLHFEMVPDRLPDELRGLLVRFPPGLVQLEVGIQTLNDEVSRKISRRQNVAKIAENLAFLREHTGVHVHADLIVGLPGESLESFGQGFDRLYSFGPEEIQVGILKRLHGAPIGRHDEQMVYAAAPPYDILRTDALSFADVQRLKRFARYFDLVCNSGRFKHTAQVLLGAQPFQHFLQFADWLWATTHATAGIAQARLAELLATHLVQVRGLAPDVAAAALEQDLGRDRVTHLPKRQARFAAPTPRAHDQ